MKVQSSAIAMQSSRRSLVHVEVRESLRRGSGTRPESREVAVSREAAPPSSAAVVRLSSAAERPAQDTTAQSGRASEIEAARAAADNDPKLMLLRRLIELLTGGRVRLLDAVRPASDESSANPAALAELVAASASRTDTGAPVEYELHAERVEFERSDVSAQGVIHTSDGRAIRFQLDVSAQRSHRETLDLSVRTGPPVQKDPLVLNFAAPAAKLESTRFRFDLDADGQLENVPLLGAGSGYLAIDLDGNGRIDSGRELFGPRSNDGFAELASYDHDHNGFIDEGDPVFAELKLWRPAAEGDGTLEALAKHNVGAIGLAHVASPFELRAADNSALGRVRSTGAYLTEDGEVRSVQQVDVDV